MSNNAFSTGNNCEPDGSHTSGSRSSQNCYHQNGSVGNSNLINHAELNEAPKPFNVSFFDDEDANSNRFTDYREWYKENHGVDYYTLPIEEIEYQLEKVTIRIPDERRREAFHARLHELLEKENHNNSNQCPYCEDEDDDDDEEDCICIWLREYRERYKRCHGVDYYTYSIGEIEYQLDKVTTRIPDEDRRIAFQARLDELLGKENDNNLNQCPYCKDDDDLSYSSSISTITLDLNYKQYKSDNCTINLETGMVNISDGSRLERGSENRGFWGEEDWMDEDWMDEDWMDEDWMDEDEEFSQNYDSESEESRHRETDRNNTHTPNQPRREEDYRPCSCSEHQHDLYTRVACTYDRVMGKKK